MSWRLSCHPVASVANWMRCTISTMRGASEHVWALVAATRKAAITYAGISPERKWRSLLQPSSAARRGELNMRATLPFHRCQGSAPNAASAFQRRADDRKCQDHPSHMTIQCRVGFMATRLPAHLFQSSFVEKSYALGQCRSHSNVRPTKNPDAFSRRGKMTSGLRSPQALVTLGDRSGQAAGFRFLRKPMRFFQ